MAILKDRKLVFNTNYCLMQIKCIAECFRREHSVIRSTFIKLPVVIKTFVLSIFEGLFYTALLYGIGSYLFHVTMTMKQNLFLNLKGSLYEI